MKHLLLLFTAALLAACSSTSQTNGIREVHFDELAYPEIFQTASDFEVIQTYAQMKKGNMRMLDPSGNEVVLGNWSDAALEPIRQELRSRGIPERYWNGRGAYTWREMQIARQRIQARYQEHKEKQELIKRLQQRRVQARNEYGDQSRSDAYLIAFDAGYQVAEMDRSEARPKTPIAIRDTVSYLIASEYGIDGDQFNLGYNHGYDLGWKDSR